MTREDRIFNEFIFHHTAHHERRLGLRSKKWVVIVKISAILRGRPWAKLIRNVVQAFSLKRMGERQRRKKRERLMQQVEWNESSMRASHTRASEVVSRLPVILTAEEDRTGVFSSRNEEAKNK
jgi:hypothetical protein